MSGKHIKYALSIRKKSELESYLCPEACYVMDANGKRIEDHEGPRPHKKVIDLAACAECESRCAYGVRYMRMVSLETLAAFGCGGKCDMCTQPCGLYIPMVEKIYERRQKWRAAKQQA